MGCTASTSATVITTVEGKAGKATLSKKPLPPIGGAAAESIPTARSKVDVPDLPVKTGKVSNNVAFEITLDENSIDNIVKRAPPKRLKRLEPITTTLTAEQLEEKQRLAEAKRDKIKQNIRLKSARSSRRRSELQKALEAGRAQETDADDADVSEAANNDAPVKAEDPAVATPRPVESMLTSRVAQQVEKLPRLNEQPTMDDQSMKSPAAKSGVVTLDNERPLRSASVLMDMSNAGAAADRGAMSDRISTPPVTNADSMARPRPSSSLEATMSAPQQPAGMPLSSRSEVLAKPSVGRHYADELSTGVAAVAIATKKAIDSDIEDEDTDVKKVAAADTALHSSRLGSAESGFISSNAHSAEATGKKPLQQSEIEAFKAAVDTKGTNSPIPTTVRSAEPQMATQRLDTFDITPSPVPKSATSPEPKLTGRISGVDRVASPAQKSVKSPEPKTTSRRFEDFDDSDGENFMSNKVTPRKATDSNSPRAPSIKDEDDDTF